MANAKSNLKEAEAKCNVLTGNLSDRVLSYDEARQEVWWIRHLIHIALDKLEAGDAGS